MTTVGMTHTATGAAPQSGLAARGVLYLIVGVATPKVAFSGGDGGGGNSQKTIAAQVMSATGGRFLGALQRLAKQPFGPYLLGLTALGLYAFGVFTLVRARYVKVSESSIGATRSGRSLRTLFTSVPTSCQTRSSTAGCASSACATVARRSVRSSHGCHAAAGNTTGMRSWSSRSRDVAAKVTMLHVRSHAPSGCLHASHRPANASGAPLDPWMYSGVRRPAVTRHS